VLPNQAFLIAAFVVVPSVMYVLYRSIAPYEPALRDMKLAGAMMWPGIAGFGIGVAHLVLDPSLVVGVAGPLAFMAVYPIVDTYVLVVIFNRAFFYKQPALAMYFAVGGAAMSVGLAFVESFRALVDPAVAVTDGGRIVMMLLLATAFVAFHSAKGLYIGTRFAEGARKKTLAVATAVEAPVGLLVLAGLLNVLTYEALGMLVVYAFAVYYYVWHVDFPSRVPESMRRTLARERKRKRRLGLGPN
jgi:hypothetical protein